MHRIFTTAVADVYPHYVTKVERKGRSRDELDEVIRWLTGFDQADIDTQIAAAWRVVGAYRDDTGEQVGFARAVSDGVNFAYLADVFVIEAHRGQGLGKRILQHMIDDGPGRDFRWTLFTGDAHGLYQQFGFTAPDTTAMFRSAR